MARSIWSGAISFGLVNVPVKLYSAVSQKEVHFNMLHATDGARVKQKRVCAKDEKEVPWEEIAKGYEIAPNRFVMVTPEELEKFDPKATRLIDILDFVDLEEIDPIYYENTYYLAPDRGAGKAYALLMAAMKRSRKVAIAHFVLRTRQYLAALRPMGRAISMSTLLYADEIVPQEQIEPLADVNDKPNEKELRMAEQLVDSLCVKWDPRNYKDDYREKVLDLLKRKAEGEEIVIPSEAEAPMGKVVNLADALEASLRARRGEYRHRDESDRAAARKGGNGKSKKKTPTKKKAS